MAFEVQEAKRSRRVVLAKDTETATLEFVGYGTDDDAAARSGFAAAAPATFVALANPLVRLDLDVSTLGGLFWTAIAHYGPDPAPLYPPVGILGPPSPVSAAPGPTEPLGPDYSFDFTGVTERITQAKETISRTKRGGGAAPDTQGAIQVTADGKVEGCERISPNLEWSRTVTFESITFEYIKDVAALVGSVNNATFYNQPAGSVLLIGGNAQTDDTRKAKVTFKFLNRPNRTNIDICTDLQVPAKKGHEYLWVSYKRVQDANNLTRQPDAAYVERIYDTADFASLRIGV